MAKETQRPVDEHPRKIGPPPELSSTDMEMKAVADCVQMEAPSRDSLSLAANDDVGAIPDEFARHVHGYLSGYVALADQKAAFVFAFSVAVLGLVHGGAAIEHIAKLASDQSAINIIATIAVLGLVAALAFSAGTIWPRTRGASDGLIFWKAIRGHTSAADYAGNIALLKPAAVVDEILRHCFELAEVCEHKYRTLNLALCAAGVGSVASVLFLLLAT